ncbi:dihydrolipoyllysine-residue acetyltransferase [Aquabacterium lacunae]|uniref:Acetyltransferase component of pyruvate dehydrogenase complex n=1 Tax=Aquabacterium lacunae TaxID=2528630 RepID=A0A4Q9H269_9BURK|nr:dihydrolipoyllysine-residue acetyltransferase [Aquabacterium lacunae]TBO28838.1 dihydrolipoyllysine-residue acetyltransferase [Aquabacterium lacunae]
MATIELSVPDIGDVSDAAVIELLVKAGDTIKPEQSLITIESDKASMEVPSAHGGVIKELKVKLGDKVSMGSLVAILEVADGAAVAAPAPAAANALTPAPAPVAATAPAPAPAVSAAPAAAAPAADTKSHPTAAVAASPLPAAGTVPHASPSVRRFARELGVPLERVPGSGPKGRITHGDVQNFVKGVVSGAVSVGASGAPAGGAAGAGSADLGGMTLLPWPKVDFTKFGPVERQPLSRIKKISGANLHRNWVRIPHVTNNEEADITELEAFRVQLNGEHAKAGTKFTMLAFLLKACAVTLRKFPQFNASLDGDDLVLKNYVHIGFAADTPNGLVVPVIRDVDQKSISQLALETAALAAKAREGKLSPAEMSGGCFSISSLGGFGGTTFTPIINAPEVAILGVCRAAMKPVWDGKAFQPRLMLPLSLSYDHRVIDGAAAAKFNAHLAALLADFRRALV